MSDGNGFAITNALAESGNFLAAAALLGGGAFMHGRELVQGSFYSLGGEPVVGEYRMGPVLYKGQKDLSRIVRFGETVADFGKGVKGLSFTGSIDNAYTHGLGGSGLVPGGLQHLNKLSVIIPTAFTAIGAMHSLATEGGEGLRDFLIQDFIANYHGTRASVDIFNVKNTDKANKFLGATGGANAAVVGDKILNPRTFLGSPMLGRIAPTAGAYIGAALVGSVGKSMMAGYFENNEGIAGLAGMVFGSSMGARMGSYLAGGIGRLAVTGAGIGAIYGTVSSGAAILKSGFRNERENRGLNYAGDISAFLTQNSNTMRQRAVQAMQKSHLNARSAFGQEATMVHTNRDMFSQYKR